MLMSEEHDQDAHVILEQFRSQERIFNNFYRMHERDTLGMFMEGLENLRDVFLLADRCFRCIDERTPGGIHAAGPVILFDQAKGIEMLKKARAEGIYSHAGCGAAGIAFEKLDEKMKRFYGKPDEYGRFYAKSIAKMAGIPYKGHLYVEPPFHVARMAVYDGSGCFDNSAEKLNKVGLPPCFVISRRYHSEPENAMREASIAATIATGDHGFGGLIKADKTPFVLLVIGGRYSKEFSQSRLTAEAEEVAKGFKGRVIVDGFVAPF